MTEYRIIYGRGSLVVDLDALLPAKSADCKKLIQFIEMAFDPEKKAEELHKYITGRLESIKNDLSACSEKTKRHAEIKSEMEKLTANAAALVKAFSNLPEIAPAADAVKIKKTMVFPMLYDKANHTSKVTPENGYTFEKADYVFEVYKRNKEYIVLLAETGMQVAFSDKLKTAPDAITARIIEALNRSAEKLIEYKNKWTAAMIQAGYMEGNEMKEYSIAKNGIIGQFEDDKVVYFRPGESGYAAALIAANQERTAAGKDMLIPAGIDPEIEKAVRAALDGGQIEAEAETDQAAPETVQEAPETAAPVQDTRETESAPEKANNAHETEPDQAETTPAQTEPDQTTTETETEKPARAVPEKSFIGTTITGRGFRIYFDPAAGKTRVIFDKVPPVATRDAVKAAGFWWSPALKSWNKGLTWKAYRAAIRLVDQLSAT